MFQDASAANHLAQIIREWVREHKGHYRFLSLTTSESLKDVLERPLQSGSTFPSSNQDLGGKSVRKKCYEVAYTF